MKNYKKQFITWLELTWYLLSEPWIKLYEFWLDHFAPKWYVYHLFYRKINKVKTIGSWINWIDWIEGAYKKKKFTREQADKLVALIKTKSENRRMSAYVPNKEDMFDKVRK